MKIQENVELAPLSYMNIGGQGKYLIDIENEEELRKVEEISREESLPVFVLGDGSNTIFSDGFHERVFVRIKTNGILKTYDSPGGANIDVDAGVNWDEFVQWTIKNKLSGIETLSGIPGTVGAAPIQNIGAYGQEVSNVITHIRVYSLEDNEFYEISNEDCNFQYRDSIFKQNLGKFIITKISFQLSKEKPKMPTYKNLALHFLSKKNKDPNAKEIRNAVIEVRDSKLPDINEKPNCGSFFGNPIVTISQAKELLEKFPDMPQFPTTDNAVKLQGGWLIEKAGFKGKEIGDNKKIIISSDSALVLIALPGATWNDLIKAKDTIIEGVGKNFGVRLEVEPNLITN